MYHTNVNLSLMAENLVQTKSETTINVDASVKNIRHVEKIILGIVLH